MIQLSQSPVVFSESPHGYRLGDKPLSGITRLIRNVLHLGVYPQASDYVKNYCIPRAGEYGTSVHRAIEKYDTLGIKVTAFPKSERFQDDGDSAYWIVEDELESYIKSRQGFEPIANEYTISDEVRYASNIDNVWRCIETQGIWLVDTKTNNLDYYPGGEASLKEYVSWQLSIYAFLFERQNPGLCVEGLACNWIRHQDAAFWVVERKPDELVELLLSVPWMLTENGFIYDGSEVAAKIHIAKPNTLDKQKTETQLLPAHVIKSVYDTYNEYQIAKDKVDRINVDIRKAMEKNGIKSWDSGVFKCTIAADSESKTFDLVRFKREHPDMYKDYIKTTHKKGGFTIKLTQ